MSAVFVIEPSRRSNGWLAIDYRDEGEVLAVIVIPNFGPDHLIGMDCWCHPDVGPGIVIHHSQN